MSHYLSVHRVKVGAASLLILFLVALVLSGNLRFVPGVVKAAEPDAATWYRCTPANVAAYTTRIHVKCTAASSGIWYFAYPTRDTANASRFLSLLSTAEVAGKQVDILYDTADLSGATYGCATGDCRPIIGLALIP